jgi:CUE domain
VSFEVVRRPDNDTVNVWRRFFGMTEAEEQVALQRLSDMFPQYDNNELLTALRERGSDQLVAEAILGGALAPPMAR